MRNLNAIKKRVAAIKSTQKITNAMRLVSISKLQQYKKLQDSLAPYFKEVAKITRDFENEEKSELKPLYIVFAPDLSLVSAYTNGLFRFLKTLEEGDVLWIGTQGYDVALKQGFNIINEKTHSEDVVLDYFIEECKEYVEDYSIQLIVPSYGSSMSLQFAVETLDVILSNDYDVVYEPSFEDVSKRYSEIVMKAMIYYTYYASKFSEYTTRRIAMESATKNADEMIEELQLVYNRVRQEAITQEISELISGMEA